MKSFAKLEYLPRHRNDLSCLSEVCQSRNEPGCVLPVFNTRDNHTAINKYTAFSQWSEDLELPPALLLCMPKSSKAIISRFAYRVIVHQIPPLQLVSSEKKAKTLVLREYTGACPRCVTPPSWGSHRIPHIRPQRHSIYIVRIKFV